MNGMNCMKCGREIALGQAFCKDCLEDMSHYPVNPTTPVQIPVQTPVAHINRRPQKAQKARKPKKPEEQILRLRKQIRLQAIAILLLLTMLIGLGFFTYQKLYSHTPTFRPGENYSTNDET